jgi:GLPGLI family protein
MKILLSFLLFISLAISAQTHRFIYEYQFKSDTAKTEFDKANMVLDINPEDVKFYDYAYAENDSINKIRKNHNFVWNDTPALIRNKNSNENMNFELLNDYFKYSTKDEIQWKLSSETKTYNQYKVQKATDNFGGRKWIAWFSNEISINEGPYKFRGLPGLIFEIADTQNQFSFKLVKSYQLDSTYNTIEFLETHMTKPLLISLQKLNKLKLEFYNDPFHDIRANFSYKPDESIQLMGVRIKSKDQIDEATNKYQKYILRNNNQLEKSNTIKYPVD